MAPAGGYKGFGQGLIVEVMCAALAGASRGPQMGSFMANDGLPIGCGQFFIALEPKGFSGWPVSPSRWPRWRAPSPPSPVRACRTPGGWPTRSGLAKEGLPIDRALHDRLRASPEPAYG